MMVTMNLFILMNSVFLIEIQRCTDGVFKDTKSTITTGFETILMTFLVAFSLKYFYGIMVNKNPNDSFVFRHFLGKVWEARSKYFQNFDSRFWYVIDNASIQKSDIIKEYAKQNKISLITIPAYFFLSMLLSLSFSLYRRKSRNCRYVESKQNPF